MWLKYICWYFLSQLICLCVFNIYFHCLFPQKAAPAPLLFPCVRSSPQHYQRPASHAFHNYSSFTINQVLTGWQITPWLVCGSPAWYLSWWLIMYVGTGDSPQCGEEIGRKKESFSYFTAWRGRTVQLTAGQWSETWWITGRGESVTRSRLRLEGWHAVWWQGGLAVTATVSASMNTEAELAGSERGKCKGGWVWVQTLKQSFLWPPMKQWHHSYSPTIKTLLCTWKYIRTKQKKRE